MLELLDVGALRSWCTTGRRALAACCGEIDAANVFPVPDADTGTNLLLTWQAAEEAVRTGPDDLAGAAGAMARGALAGARGNSGVLLSQLLCGFAQGLAAAPGRGATAADLAAGLAAGAALARSALAEPVEGTLLTVARAAAEAAAATAQSAGDPSVVDVVGAAVTAAEQALAATPEQLPVLRQAGVVDAGGSGWVVLLRALAGVVDPAGLPASPGTAPAPAATAGAPHRVLGPLVETAAAAPGPAAGLPPVPAEFPAAELPAAELPAAGEFEVQYVLSALPDGAPGSAAVELRARLAGLGTSVAVGAGDDLLQVHVHVPVGGIGPALEAGLAVGRPSGVRVTPLPPARSEAEAAAPGAARASGRVVLAVASGAGLAGLLADAGAHVVAPPSAASGPALLEAVRGAGATEVVLLAEPAVRCAAEDAARCAAERGIDVRVVPLDDALQGLAALAVADPLRPLPDDVAAMAAAAAGMRCAEVRLAVTAADTSAGPCLPGDVLGLVDGRVAAVGADPEEVARRLLDLLVRGAELLTVVADPDAGDGVLARLLPYVRASWPEVEVHAAAGEVPGRCLVLGVE